MSLKTDYIIVLDLELTCWASGAPPPNQQSEIIEIGCCKLAHNGEVWDKESIYIWPLNFSAISPYCIQLTGITTELLKREGMPFDGALNKVVKLYGPRHRVVATWSNGDRHAVRTQCEAMGLKYPLGWHSLDVNALYALIRNRRPVGLSRALAFEGIEFQGRPHCGADDAFNTASLLHKLIGKESKP